MRKNKPLSPTNVPVDRDKRDVWIQILTYLILSVLVFWFLQKFCRYDYTYDEQFRMFRYSWNYAEPLLFSAGGISTYIADYLTQFYYWPACGALINTLFFLGTALGVFFILRRPRSGASEEAYPGLGWFVQRYGYRFKENSSG